MAGASPRSPWTSPTGLFGTIEEVSEAEARAQIETNLFGAPWVTQAALPILRAQRSGRIIQISSIGGVNAFPTVGLYHASKWGLEGFSQALAQEVAGSAYDAARTAIASLRGPAMLKLVDSKDPPLRVFFGTGGLPMTRAEYARRLQPGNSGTTSRSRRRGISRPGTGADRTGAHQFFSAALVVG